MNNVCTSTCLSENSKDPKGGYFRQCHYMVMINIKTQNHENAYSYNVKRISKHFMSHNGKFKTDLLHLLSIELNELI